MTDQTETATCPHCPHPAHAPGVECEGGVDHGPKHWHRCLCLNLVNAEGSCHPLMDCQGGKLGYSDIWYLQRGHSLSSADGPVTPDVLKTTAVPSAVPAPAASRAEAVASCPGRELDPNPCRCPCYGCKHHCSAHDPDDTDLTETDIDRMMAGGVPVQIVTAPPATYGANESSSRPDQATAAGQNLTFTPPAADRAELRAELKPWQLLGGEDPGTVPDSGRLVGGRRLALPASVDRATVLQEVAARIRAHCPDHLDADSVDGSWMVCHCAVADDLDLRLAVEAQQQTGDERPVYAWAQTVDSADGGQTVHIPGVHHSGTGPEVSAIVVSREDVPVLAAMLADLPAVVPGRAGEEPADETQTLAAMFEGLHTLLATSSRDWSTYRVDAWLWAVLCGWDCEQAIHDETCTHGAMEEMQQRHGWDDEAVAKARRYRAVVRAIESHAAGPAGGAQQPKEA